ncbi:Monothiol glutaredoxin-S14 like [Actinidia chinensis var. chinensis]|uniref:Monothiol glutaredoxin-S14 like n=1 Tax=Actinidia chinensis var. chinensis TaxID=1590841 RepID=A0A2R6RVB5_ACTCC|nr:Monothiol glutaredoxin-S14 like [Actinidia chinensis var. chinensis]
MACALTSLSVPSSSIRQAKASLIIVKAWTNTNTMAATPSLVQYPRISFAYNSVHNRRIDPGPVRCLSAITPELKTTLDKVVTSHKVVLFMKGTKEFPQCGFSHTVVQILTSLNVPFETLNILENDVLRQGLKEYSNWPTFPQLYIDGEFFGGCDIAVEAYKSGQLQELLEKTLCS